MWFTNPVTNTKNCIFNLYIAFHNGFILQRINFKGVDFVLNFPPGSMQTCRHAQTHTAVLEIMVGHWTFSDQN